MNEMEEDKELFEFRIVFGGWKVCVMERPDGSRYVRDGSSMFGIETLEWRRSNLEAMLDDTHRALDLLMGKPEE